MAFQQPSPTPDPNAAPVDSTTSPYQQPVDASASQQAPIPQSITDAASAAAAANPPQQKSGGGFFGWINSAAKDVGNALGDVISKVPGARAVGNVWNTVYTNVISHPAATVIAIANKAAYNEIHGGMNPIAAVGSALAPSSWAQAYQATNHISPGQEVVLFTGSGLVKGLTSSDKTKMVDPTNATQVQTWFQNNSLASLGSGAADAGFRMLDPVAAAVKFGGKTAATIKNAPIAEAATTADIENVVNSPRNMKLQQKVAAAPTFSAVKQLVKDSPQSYTLASFLHAAGGDIPKIQEVFRIGMGDSSALDRLAQDQGTLAEGAATVSAGNALAPTAGEVLPVISSKLVAYRASAMLTPADVAFKSVLSDMDPAAFDDWFKGPSKLKAQHAQEAFNSAMDENQGLQDLFGSMRARTTAPLFNSGKATRQLATPSIGAGRGLSLTSIPQDAFDSVMHPTHMAQVIHNHVADPIIRIYHTFTDQRPTATVEFGTEQAVRQAKALLNTSSIIAPDVKDGMLFDFAHANARGRASSQAAWDGMEQKLHQVTAEHFGLDVEHGDTMYHEYASRRNMGVQSYVSKDYGTLNGNAVLPSLEHEVITDPFLETQLKRGAQPTADMRDYERALKRMNDNGITAHIKDLGDKGHVVLVNTLDNVYKTWKLLTLVSGHRAFNHIGDDALRSVVKLGSLRTLSNVAQGAGNFLYNRALPLTKGMIAHNLEGKFDHEVAIAKAEYQGLRSRFLTQQERMAEGEPILPANQIDANAVSDAKRKLDGMRQQGPPVATKRRLGEGTFSVPGTNVLYPEPLGGVQGDYNRIMTGADATWTEGFDRSAIADYNSLGQLSDHDVITARDGVKAHGAAIQRYVNNQLTKAAVPKMMLAGKTDAEIYRFLTTTPEGMRVVRMLPKSDPLAMIEHSRDHINTYLPSQWMKDKAERGNITADDIQNQWPSASQRPPVHGNLAVLPGVKQPGVGYLDRALQKVIKVTGSLPDDILVRHPLANELYKTNFTRLVNQMDAQGVDVPLGSPMYDTLHRTAMKQTMHTMQNTLYDSSRFVGAGGALRMVMPFFNAWHNAIGSWSHLIAQNPQLLVRAAQGKHALWNAPFSIDTTTGQKANSHTSMENLGFIMHLPKGVAKALGLGTQSDFVVQAKTVVSPTYADSVGNPGFGPLVTIPVNQMVKDNPSLMGNPFVEQVLGGRISSNSFQSGIPSAATQALNIGSVAGFTGDGSDPASAAYMTLSIYQDQMHDYVTGKRSTPPSMKDAQSQAKWVSAISGIVNRLMPLGYKPQSQYKFLTDEYHNMLSANNGDTNLTDQQFFQKEGTAGWLYTQSLGKNVGGVAATRNAAVDYKANQALLKAHPELAAVVVGPDGNGSYNNEAYQWEVANGLRTKLTPEAAVKQAQANLGWVEYNKMNAGIDAQLQARGLTNINANGAKDLAAQKAAFVQQMGNPTAPGYNPDFYDSYTSFNKNQYETRITALAQIAQSPSLLANPVRSDIKSLNAYIQTRDQIFSTLQSRKSKSLSAKANSDLKDYLDSYVGALKQGDTKFGPLYERYLAKDDFSEPI